MINRSFSAIVKKGDQVVTTCPPGVGGTLALTFIFLGALTISAADKPGPLRAKGSRLDQSVGSPSSFEPSSGDNQRATSKELPGFAGSGGIVKGSDEFEFVYRVKLPEINGDARLWIPLAKTDAFQTVTQEEINIPIKWEKIHDRDYGNDICVLHPQPADSGKDIELRYLVIRKEKSAYPAKGEDPARFLRPEKLVPVNETFKTLAAEATAGKKGDLERAKALYDHVLGRMRYDKSGTGWGRGDAIYACDARTGNCSDFHAYFVALARSSGIPARFAIGATIPADKKEGAIEGYHCWAEFFADGRWVPVDISEAWKNPALADYYFGHNPANRFELTRGRDLVVDPAPATGPINFLVYPLLEIDGKIVKPETSFAFRRTRV